MAAVFPPKLSTGILLPILCLADVVAVSWHRRNGRFEHIFRLLPWTLVGLAAGSVIIRHISDHMFKPVIGLIVLLMLAINIVHRRTEPSKPRPLFAVLLGLAAGLATQLANAAGPLMIIYLTAMNLPKHYFVGTAAWFFLILNWLKLPLFAWDGRLSCQSISGGVLMVPFILLGAAVGIVLLKRLSQVWFKVVVTSLAALAALRLALSPLW
jgi:uncharacterized membrane protein YfcA